MRKSPLRPQVFRRVFHSLRKLQALVSQCLRPLFRTFRSPFYDDEPLGPQPDGGEGGSDLPPYPEEPFGDVSLAAGTLALCSRVMNPELRHLLIDLVFAAGDDEQLLEAVGDVAELCDLAPYGVEMPVERRPRGPLFRAGGAG